jgi:hypothetical protein
MPRFAPFFGFALAPLLLGAVATCWTSRIAYSCPVCCGVSQTFAEEMENAQVVAIVTLRERPGDPGPEIPGVELEAPKAKFEIERLIKGDALAEPKQLVEAHYSGDAKPGERFLLMAVNDPPLTWYGPVPMTFRSEAYLSQLFKLGGDAKTRMQFFYSYLQDPDDLMARDAYDELHKFDYPQLKELKENLDHDSLIVGIKNKETPASRRRLLLRLLSICGSKQDVPLLEGFIRSKDRDERRGMDSVIACYLALQGTVGMELVEEQFLKNKAAGYADTYAAIIALRSSEAERIPQQRRVEAFRLMLDRPDLADLVIGDLARLDDWHQLDRLLAMFKAELARPGEKNSWVRIPIINYLRACPLPKAKDLLLECERLDPDSMQRAKEFMPDIAPKPQKFANFQPYRPAFPPLD